MEGEAAGQRGGLCRWLHKKSLQTVVGARMDHKPGYPEVSVSQGRAIQRASERASVYLPQPHSPSTQIPQTTQTGLQMTTPYLIYDL